MPASWDRSARIAVGGDSAAGNLAAVSALMAREQGGPEMVFQLLVYPATGYAATGRDVSPACEGPEPAKSWHLTGRYDLRPGPR